MKRQVKILKALADETRLNIVRLLMSGEICVCEISSSTRKRQPTVSQHLRVLKEAGLIESKQKGLNIYYKLKDDKVPQLMSVLGLDAIEHHGGARCPGYQN
jgi:ArsR family transcriptional regulator